MNLQPIMPQQVSPISSHFSVPLPNLLKSPTSKSRLQKEDENIHHGSKKKLLIWHFHFQITPCNTSPSHIYPGYKVQKHTTKGTLTLEPKLNQSSCSLNYQVCYKGSFITIYNRPRIHGTTDKKNGNLMVFTQQIREF